jgi:hypothetical protein
LGPSSAETGNEIRSQDESSTQENRKKGSKLTISKLVLKGVSPLVPDLPYQCLDSSSSYSSLKSSIVKKNF